jgi:hypothetical protein
MIAANYHERAQPRLLSRTMFDSLIGGTYVKITLMGKHISPAGAAECRFMQFKIGSDKSQH